MVGWYGRPHTDYEKGKEDMMNCVQVIGRITADPEVKVSQSGKSILVFSLAVQRDYKNRSGEYDTDFFRCVAYQSSADYLGKYAKKGDMLAVVGALRQNTYENREGKKVSSVEISVSSVQILSRKKSMPAEDGIDEMQPLDDVPS